MFKVTRYSMNLRFKDAIKLKHFITDCNLFIYHNRLAVLQQYSLKVLISATSIGISQQG